MSNELSPYGEAVYAIRARRGRMGVVGEMAKEARLAGVTAQQWYHLLRTKDPHISTVQRMAKGAGVKTSSLVAEAEKLGG